MDRATIPDDYEAAFMLTSEMPGLFPTVEDFKAVLHTISPEELPAVRLEIRQAAARIFDNWRNLESIVQRHEATIQKRWTNKSKMKRRELLLAIWPKMAQNHRPDIILDKKSFSSSTWKKEVQRVRQGKPIQPEMYEGWQREALLMPYINLHDLTKTEPILLMMNARARWSPHVFAKKDLQFSTSCIWMTKWRALEGYIMDFDGRQTGPEAYGDLKEGNWEQVIVATGVDRRLAHGTINPGDGLWILEIQDRIYKFLLDVVLRILHDIPKDELTGPKYGIKPEPPLPSANFRADGVVSLATTNLEAIYSSPGQMNLHRLQLLLTARANEEEDKLWALREDPGRFSEALEDFIAHRPEYVPDHLGKQHPLTTTHGCRLRWGPDISLEDMLCSSFLLSSFNNAELWGSLVQDITDLVRLQEQYFGSRNIESRDPLPEPFAVALYQFEVTLCLFVKQELSFLRRAVYSSPPLRPYVRRTSGDTLNSFSTRSGKRPPQHICEFTTILFRLFDEAWLEQAGHIAGVQSLMEQYDMLIDTVPDARQAISSYVAEEISTLALFSECLRQIHLFQPWATTSHKDMATPQVKAILKAHFDEIQHELEPLEKFRPSPRVQSMTAEAAKSQYHVHKKRTASNVDAMQKAETLLDQMWDAMLAEMEQQNALPTHTKNILFLQGRELHRTTDWVEPVKSPKKTPLQLESPDVLIQPFGGLDIDKNNRVQDFLTEKTKIKTRGPAAPQASTSTQAQNTDQEDQSPAHIIQVDRRALKVFSTLFHTPSSTSKPGEVPWSEFLHAMRSAGFGMEKLQGSAWQFTPQRSDNGRTVAGMRSISFHEPHPHSRIPFWHARMHGRRLARAYGWGGATFVAK